MGAKTLPQRQSGASTRDEDKLGYMNLMTHARKIVQRAVTSAKLRRLALMRRLFPLRQSLRKRLGRRRQVEGMNLVGYVRAELGLGAAARGMASALEAGHVPFAIVNYNFDIVSPETHCEWQHKEIERPDYPVTLICINPDNTTNLRARLPQKLLADRYVIGNWFWELPELPKEWFKDFKLVNEVWVASSFVQEAVARVSPVPVTRIPPAVQVEAVEPLPRAHFGLPEKAFLFLAVADTRSGLERKNPWGAIQAFTRAFSETDTNVGLVVKLNTAEFQRDEVAKLLTSISHRKNIFLLDCLLPRTEMLALLQSVDCVVSLHRSEGFGLIPAEAMSFGKPVILTAWSGNTDFMTADNCAAVDFELVSLGKDYGPYKADQLWAEPDLDHAAQWMKRLVDEPELAEAMGQRAQETIKTGFSPEAIGKLIRSRLEAIGKEW